MKKCTFCKKTKKASEFYTLRSLVVYPYCKECSCKIANRSRWLKQIAGGKLATRISHLEETIKEMKGVLRRHKAGKNAVYW